MIKRASSTVKVFGTVLVLIAAIVFPVLHNAKNETKNYETAGGSIVVLFNDNIEDKALNVLTASFGTPVTVVRHIGDYALLHVDPIGESNQIIEKLKRTPGVKTAQSDQTITSTGFSNDLFAGSQWAIENSGHYYHVTDKSKEDIVSTEDVDMNVSSAWEQLDRKDLAKREVIVAVIDTGVDSQHPDLAEHIWMNQNEIPADNIDNDGNGYVDDINGWDFYNNDASICHYKYNDDFKMILSDPQDNDDHGTHVAGIIGAVTDNKIGIAGVASNIDIKLMPLKINGGSDDTGSVSSAIEAIKYADQMGAVICNLSWGTTQYSEALRQVMKESDMLFVAAAGNSGSNNNTNPIYPANFKLPNLISVAYINPDGKLNKNSNYGTSTVDLAAPGEDIISTLVGSYGTMSGTSMATPQVTGVAAMVYACRENLYPSEVKDIILHNLKLLPGLDGLIKNPGIPDAKLALLSVKTLSGDKYPPNLSFVTVIDKSKLIIQVTVDDKGESGVRTVKWMYGNRKIEDFNNGHAGTDVVKNRINVSKAGIYTFYSADYAGNEMITTYNVKDDTTAPRITAAYKIADTYKSRTVSVSIAELQSGIKRVKYMAGKKKAEDFLASGAGTEIMLNDNKGTFSVKKDGVYTIFASDNRGNLSVKQIEVKTVKIKELKLAQRKIMLLIGDRYYLIPMAKPANTTDKITFTSSNAKVAEVTTTGKITARTEGKTYITAKSTSGITVKCEITVKKAGK